MADLTRPQYISIDSARLKRYGDDLTGTNYRTTRQYTGNPYYRNNGGASQESKTFRARARAEATSNRYTERDFTFRNNDQIDLINNVGEAMNGLAQTLISLNIPVMFDPKGYLAYSKKDNYGNNTWSSNLTGLKKQIRDSGANLKFLMLPHWSMVINWHKLLNSLNNYKKNSNVSPDTLYDRNRFNRIKRLDQQRKYYLAYPDRVAAKLNKYDENIANYTLRQREMQDRFKFLVTQDVVVNDMIGEVQVQTKRPPLREDAPAILKGKKPASYKLSRPPVLTSPLREDSGARGGLLEESEFLLRNRGRTREPTTRTNRFDNSKERERANEY